MNRGQWQQNHWPRFDGLMAGCPIGLKCRVPCTNQKCLTPHIIKSTHQRGRGLSVWSLRLNAEGTASACTSLLSGPLKTPSSPTNYNEIHLHASSEDVGVDVGVTFSNWSCFLVRQLAEISPHPHKETFAC